MRILHTGDIHLDSAFCAYGARDAERQREAGRALLRRIFGCAAKEGAQLILISGDLFDSRFVSPETGELFCALVEECGIPVVVSPGNHDPYFENSFYAKAAERLGDKLFVFTSPELQIFDIDSLRVRVFGYAFTSAALSESPLSGAEMPQDNGYTRIFCGHGDIFSPVSRYAPITENELRKFDFAYAALGHVHNAWNAEKMGGRARYCGFGEGRSFDELGDGGVWIVNIDSESFTCERRILSNKAFYILKLGLCSEDTLSSAKERICGQIKEQNYSLNAHLRLILEGVAQENLVKELLTATQEICSDCGLEYLELLDRVMPVLDGEYLERDTTLRGELYRVLRPKLMSSDNEERARAIKALKIGLAAIDGRSIFGADEKGVWV